jgi:hypothetical protein
MAGQIGAVTTTTQMAGRDETSEISRVSILRKASRPLHLSREAQMRPAAFSGLALAVSSAVSSSCATS